MAENSAKDPRQHSYKSFSPYTNNNGDISFPSGFRITMVHLGSWFVPEGEASGFHDVYADQEAVKVFSKTGKFPDGATIVKELRSSASGNYTTGQGVHFATDEVKQWFVMIKDTQRRFPGNPLWGDGWGWALFKGDNRELNVVENYSSDCLGCHVPAKKSDWIYTEAYPTLKNSYMKLETLSDN